MLINPLIFILLVISVFGLAVVILFIITSYNHLMKRIADSEMEKAHIRDASNERAENLLNEARTKHIELIEQANTKAASIIDEASAIKSDSNQATQVQLGKLLALQKDTLDKMSQELQSSYDQALQRLEKRDVEAFENITKDAEANADKEMQAFTNTIRKETIDAHQIIESRLEEQYAKAEQDIAAYKQEQYKKIDEAAYPLLKNVMGILLGRTLSSSEQQDLVLQSLEQAKKEMTTTKN